MSSSLTFSELDVIYKRVAEMRKTAKLKEGITRITLMNEPSVYTDILKNIVRVYKFKYETDARIKYIIEAIFANGKTYRIFVTKFKVTYVYNLRPSEYRVSTSKVFDLGNIVLGDEWCPSTAAIPGFLTDPEYEFIRWLQGSDKEWSNMCYIVDQCYIE